MDVADRAVLAVEQDGDPLLTVELMAQALPAQMNPAAMSFRRRVRRVVSRH
jgi:hypothetical protein